MSSIQTPEVNLKDLVREARGLFENLSFDYASQWKSQDSSRRVIGYLPMYVPREVMHALNMLPVGLFGAGDRIPVVRGDAYFQSYICHLPRTVIEMGLNGSFDAMDGFIFPAICDVIRNLSGIFHLTFKNKLIRYLDFPQNFEAQVGGAFYERELRQLCLDLSELNDRRVDTRSLNDSIALYNQNRCLLGELSDFRAKNPHKLGTVEFYLIVRAGCVMSVEDHNRFLALVLSSVVRVEAEVEDKIRVVISGAFCEQPPLGLIKSIENAGCYIVDDDFQLGTKWIEGTVPDNTDDPIGALVEAYVNHSTASSAVYDGNDPKERRMVEQVRRSRADGVIFCAPSFCDPALLDRPILEKAMDRNHIRHISFQYHENLGQFHVVKEQAGTFADMIKLWD